MKFKYLTLIGLFFYENIYAQHKIINQFMNFASNADMACYEEKIQQDLNKFDKWLVDSLPKLNKGMSPWYRPGNVNLHKEDKIFVLAVSLANTENYNSEDNIYDYLIIDSLRTFIAVCVDKKMNVTGVTDTGEPGTFVDLKDNFYYYAKRWKNMIKNIRKENPDLILYCNDCCWRFHFLYIKNGKIHVYNYKKRNGDEFNEYVRKWYTGINYIRKSNIMTVPYCKSFTGERNFHRFSGHTPPDEVRICPTP